MLFKNTTGVISIVLTTKEISRQIEFTSKDIKWIKIGMLHSEQS